jgi:hypothetical protein
MRRSLAVLTLAAVAALFAVSSAWAGSPHFIKNATSASLSGSTLVCSFKETGLESGSVENIVCSATAATTYECVNNGGKNPSASNKTTTVSDVAGSGTFPADKNGNVSGQVSASPPTAEQLGFSCPKGQTVTFVGVTYSNVSVQDTTSGASQSIPGTFTYTNPSAP